MRTQRPNVLLVLLDQWRFDAAGFAGSTIARTPHFDRLASEGVQFSQTYCASPVCSPAKASLLTGLYPHAHDQLGNYNPRREHQPHYHLRRDVPTLGDVFHDAGYDCGVIGPWHLGSDDTPQRGFHAHWQTTGYQSAATDTYLQAINQAGEAEALRQDRSPVTRIDTPRGPVDVPVAPARISPPLQRTTWMVDRGIDFLASRTSASPPFCMLLSIKDPHAPIAPPADLLGLYKAEDIPLPPHYDDDFSGRYIGAPRNRIGPSLGPEGIRLYLQHYYALLSHVDAQFGRLMQALERLHLDDSTMVVLTSDHGEMLGAHGLFNKVVLHEPSVRVPWVVRWRGAVRGGGRISTPVSSVDLLPTLCDLAEVAGPARLHGRSLATALRDGGEPSQRDVFAEIGTHDALRGSEIEEELGHGVMIRRDSWKLTWYRHGVVELYDLAADPHEMRNLAGEPEHAERVRELRAALAEGLDPPGAGVYGWVRGGAGVV